MEDKTFVLFLKSWVEEGVDTGGVTGCCCCLENRTFWNSWVKEGVDTVGNGVLLLFGGEYFFEILGGGVC